LPLNPTELLLSFLDFKKALISPFGKSSVSFLASNPLPRCDQQYPVILLSVMISLP